MRSDPLSAPAESEATRQRGPGIRIALGAALIISGPFLTFGKAEVTLDGRTRLGAFQGIDTDDGKIFVFIGVVLLMLALVMIFTKSSRAHFNTAGCVLFVSSSLFLYTLMDIFELPEKIRRAFYLSLDSLVADVSYAQFKDANLKTYVGIGLYMVAVGALTAAIVAARAIRRSRQ